MRKVTKIIIHCSATFEGQEFDVDDIREWHLRRGWRDVGYHYVIKLDGTVQEGRPLEEVGAHAKNHNRNSVGICYIGGLSEDRKPKDTRTQEQLISLRNLVAEILFQFPNATVLGHNQISSKACPSFDVPEWMEATGLGGYAWTGFD